MAIVVREAIQDRDAERRSQGDEVFAIVVVSQASTQEAGIAAARRFGRGNVGETPRRPQLIHQPVLPSPNPGFPSEYGPVARPILLYDDKRYLLARSAGDGRHPLTGAVGLSATCVCPTITRF